MPFPRADLTGQVFGKLTVVGYESLNKHSQSVWLCSCACGGTKLVSIVSLKNGSTKSCGCLRRESWVLRPTKSVGAYTFRCSRCGDLFPLEGKSKGNYRCTACNRKYHRQRYAANPEKVRASQTEYMNKNRVQINATRNAQRRADPAMYLFKLAQRRARVRGIPFSLTLEDVVIPEVCPVLGTPLVFQAPGGRGFPLPNSPTLDRLIPHLGYVRGNVAVISWRANSLKKDGSLNEFEMLVRWMEGQYHA